MKASMSRLKFFEALYKGLKKCPKYLDWKSDFSYVQREIEDCSRHPTDKEFIPHPMSLAAVISRRVLVASDYDVGCDDTGEDMKGKYQKIAGDME